MTAPVDVALTAGTHTLTLIGRSSGLLVDSVMVLADHRCAPVDLGANCAISDNVPPVDAAPPTTTLTAPADGATIDATVDLTADADDDIAVTRVDFVVGDAVVGSATSAPYTFSWDTSTVPDGTYVLQSKAYDAVGNVTSSTPVTVAVLNADAVPPDPPAAVAATASSASSVGVSWTAAHDNIVVKRYLIDRDGVQIGTTTATSYSDTGLSDITNYTYSVYAVDAAGNVSDVSPTSTATTPDGTPPTAPTAPTATATAQDTVSIGWAASSDNVGVVGYVVQRNGAVVGTTTSELALTDVGLAAGTAYSYTVQAIDLAGNVSAPSLVAAATTPDTTAPTTPTALRSTATTATSVSLAWTAATDNVAVARYLVFRGGVQVGTSTTPTYTNVGLTALTSYTYTVFAQDAASNTSLVSNSVSVTTPTAADTTPPSAPSSVIATVTAFNQISLSWGTATDNVGVTAYRLSRSGAQLQQSSARTFVDSGLAAATSFTYSVVALDAAGNASAARTVTIATPASAAPSGAGWAGAYFNNTTLSGGPIGRLDSTVNFSWGSGAPMAGIGADNFSARWSGQLTPTKSGSYTFTTTTSGGVRLWVNDVLVLDHWVAGTATHTATVSLTAGAATNVRMEYFATTGTASAQLFWTGPSVAKTVIPSNVMTSASSGLTGTYFTGTALTTPPTLLRLDRTLNFDWGTGTPDSRLPVDNFTVRWSGKIKPTTSTSYTFYTDTAGGVRLWVNGQLLVDNWSLHSLATNSAKITLTAGTSYDIRLEYQQGTGVASAKLSWSNSSFGKTIVPQSALRDR